MGSWKALPHPMATTEHLEEGWEGDWGDQSADAMDYAIQAIVSTFQSEFGRKPTKAELRYGLEFAISIYEED